MRSCHVLLVLPLLLASFGPAAAGPEDALIRNGDFATWQGGRPVGWKVEEGAHLGYRGPQAPTNAFEPLEGGGLASVGSRTTQRWNLLKQRFVARPGETFRLSWEARGVDLRREGSQFENAWVGAFFKDGTGQRLAFPTSRVRATSWAPDLLHVTAPPGTAFGEVALFCSVSGRLEVRDLQLVRRPPEASFDVLVEDMDRHYPFFELHEIDWQALVAEHRPRVEAAEGIAPFAVAVSDMLAALEDGHVWITLPDGRRLVPHAPEVDTNFDVSQVHARLASKRPVIRNVLAGRTKQGHGYFALGAMRGTKPQLAQVDGAWRSLFDAEAILLDLRVNGGGDERWGRLLLGCLVDEPLLYARSRWRGGPAHDAFHEGEPRHVPPRPDARYGGRVIALIGPGCVSSGEAMAMMLQAMPHVTLVGQPTRGSSGNPAPLHLPNRVVVWYSRWISLFPDGTPLERRGVQPDVTVPHEKGSDPAFDAALRLLQKQDGR